ncbi:GTPase [Mycoplasmoides alvi]|uniref:GTPase n=1 Tax=Mycoplasmoides alvi TaxID=78580 RepID=UPI000AC63187|nr:GTPase [Mycoplasmoides alvi]
MNINKKCLGCGVFLTNIIDKIGYTPVIEKAKLCQRCFKLKYYNQDTFNHKKDDIEKHVTNVLNKFDFSDKTTFYVCSFSQIFFKKNEILKLKEKSKKFFLIISKIDLFTDIFDINLLSRKINDLIDKYDFKVKKEQIIICSSLKKLNFKLIDNALLKASKIKSKVVFCGPTNSGKSSIINWILKHQENFKNDFLTTSYYKNTTQDIKQIIIPNYATIIDLPGFIDKNSFQTLISDENLKNFSGSKSKFVNKVFQIKNDRLFKFKNFAEIIVIVDNEKNKQKNLISYLNQNVEIYGQNLKNNKINPLIENKNKKMAQYEYILKDDFNILFFDNLGFIVLKNILLLKINMDKNISKPILINNSRF